MVVFTKELIAKIILNIPGIKKNGSFFIGTCNEDVIAGYCLDSPPNRNYIWRFVLPSYDKMDFLHTALGRRIISFSKKFEHEAYKSVEELKDFITEDWNDLKNIKSCGDIVYYIEKENIEGYYVEWVKLITYIKQSKFEEAALLYKNLNNDDIFINSALNSEKFKLLSKAISDFFWEDAQNIISIWSRETKESLC